MGGYSLGNVASYCVECGELVYGRRFPLDLIGAVYKSYVRPAIMFGSEAWCLTESEMVILRRTEIHVDSNVLKTDQR